MSAYKNQASKRTAPKKESLNIAATDAKLKTAKPSAGSASSKPSGAAIYVTKAGE